MLIVCVEDGQDIITWVLFSVGRVRCFVVLFVRLFVCFMGDCGVRGWGAGDDEDGVILETRHECITLNVREIDG